MTVDALVTANFALGQDFVPKVEQFYSDVTLTGSYQNIFSLSGVGSIRYFRIQTNTEKWYLKIIVDGTTGYEIYGKDFRDFNFGVDMDKEANAPLKVAEDGRDMCHNFEPPVNYETSFQVQMKNGGTPAKATRGFLLYRVEKT